MEQIIKPALNISDSAFDGGQAGNLTLLAGIQWHRIDFTVYDHERTKFVAMESFDTGNLQLPGQLMNKILQVAESSALLKNQYTATRVLWGGADYTLVPDELFDENHIKTYLNFTHSLQPGNLIASNHIGGLAAHNVYAVPAIIRETLVQLFPAHRMTHQLTTLLETLFIMNRNEGSETKVYANVSARFYDLIIMRDGKLILCNTFEFSTAEDFLYYLLFAFEQLQISPGETPVTLIGNISKPGMIHDLLKQYIGEVQFIARGKAWDQSYVFDELPEHVYFNLLSYFLCGS